MKATQTSGGEAKVTQGHGLGLLQKCGPGGSRADRTVVEAPAEPGKANQLHPPQGTDGEKKIWSGGSCWGISSHLTLY